MTSFAVDRASTCSHVVTRGDKIGLRFPWRYLTTTCLPPYIHLAGPGDTPLLLTSFMQPARRLLSQRPPPLAQALRANPPSHPRRANMSPKVDPAILEALGLDPDVTTISSHGGSGFASTFKLSSVVDGKDKNFFVKTGAGSDSELMFQGLSVRPPPLPPASPLHTSCAPLHLLRPTTCARACPLLTCAPCLLQVNMPR